MPGSNDEPLYEGSHVTSGNNAVQEAEATEPEMKKDVTQDRFDALLNGQAEAKALARMALDPEMRAILEARQRGEKVKIVPQNAPVEEVKAPETIDYDQLTNTQLMQKLPDVLSGSFKKLMQDAVTPLLEKIQRLEGASQHVLADKVSREIQDAERTFPDLAQYKADMAQLNQTHQGLSVKQLYALAKFNKTGGVELQRPTQTEKPNNSSARPSAAAQRKSPLPSGNKGFRQLLDEALSNKDFILSDD
jgi:hypothetical protein